MNNDSPKSTYYPALDGLRGIAIILVILYHNFSFIGVFNYGWLGVDLFFVLSGFLITEILLRSRDATNYFKNFYMRRMLRIFPLYYLVLILIIIIFPLFKTLPYNFSFYTTNQWWFWLYAENWLLIFKKWTDTDYVLNHFWSLAVEEQFYLLWPLVLVLIRNMKLLLLLCGTLLVCIIATRFYLWSNSTIFPDYHNLFLFTRIDGILIGASLAIIKKINYQFLKKYSYLVMLSLAAFNFIFFFINKHQSFAFPYWAIVGYTTFAAIFALIVYEAVDKSSSVLQVILTNSILKFIGKVSYGFYIFHWPVFVMLYKPVNSWILSFITQGLFSQIATSFVLTAVAFIISILSFYSFERFWLQLKTRFV